MMPVRHIAGLAVALVCYSGIMSNITSAGDTVVIELDSGKRIRAHSIHASSQASDQLILSSGTDQIQIQRKVNWSRVRKLSAPVAMLADLQVPPGIQVIDPESKPSSLRELDLHPGPEFAKDRDEKLRSFFRYPPPPPVPDQFAYDPIPSGDCLLEVPCGRLPPPPCGPLFKLDPGVVVGVRYENPQTIMTDQPAELGIVRLATEPRELIVTARPFNRNGLADWNSLEVSILGRNASGEPCPVRGSLKCTLWVRQAKLVRAFAEIYFEEPRGIIRLQQWSQFLDGSETDVNGVQKVILALPPQSPDHNLSLGDYGLLTVDLDIPGQGRLATSSDPIPLRQGGYVRNRAVPDFGSSLLPAESVSESVFGSGNWPAPLSGLRPDSRRFTVQP